MTLRDWMEREAVTPQKLADLVGVDVALLRSWASGRVMPSYGERQLVAQMTKGEVRVTDWGGKR